MDYDLIYNILGYCGSTFLTIMMIPQVITSYRTKKVDDISFLFVSLNILAVSCLVPYSLYFRLYPVLVANLSVGVCNLLLVFLKIYIIQTKNNVEIEMSNSERNI